MDGCRSNSSSASGNSRIRSDAQKMKYVCVTGGVVSGLGKGTITDCTPPGTLSLLPAVPVAILQIYGY